jgi:hypothetical protein
MGIEHGGVGTYLPAADQVDEGGHGLALVDRIGDHALGARGEPHRVEGRAVRDAVAAGVVALVEVDVVVGQLPLDADELGGLPCDAADLVAGLCRRGRRVDAEDTPRPAVRAGERGEASDHPGLGAAGDRAHEDGVEVDSELTFLFGELVGPVGEPETAEGMVGGAGRDRVRPPAGRFDLPQHLLPAFLEADPEPGAHQPDVGTGEPADQDVAHLVVDRIGPVDPAFLNEHALQADPGGHRGDLAGVVGLDTADRHERVTALGQGVGDEVLQLAGLVAAVGDARVAVLALGPDRRTPQMLRQPVEPMHRRGAEQQRIPLERVD